MSFSGHVPHNGLVSSPLDLFQPPTPVVPSEDPPPFTLEYENLLIIYECPLFAPAILPRPTLYWTRSQYCTSFRVSPPFHPNWFFCEGLTSTTLHCTSAHHRLQPRPRQSSSVWDLRTFGTILKPEVVHLHFPRFVPSLYLLKHKIFSTTTSSPYFLRTFDPLVDPHPLFTVL